MQATCNEYQYHHTINTPPLTIATVLHILATNVFLSLNLPEPLEIQVSLSLLLILQVPVIDAVRLYNYTAALMLQQYGKSNR